MQSMNSQIYELFHSRLTLMLHLFILYDIQ